MPEKLIIKKILTVTSLKCMPESQSRVSISPKFRADSEQGLTSLSKRYRQFETSLSIQSLAPVLMPLFKRRLKTVSFNRA